MSRIASYFSLVSLSERKYAMGQRPKRFPECTTLPCPPCFSLACVLDDRLLYFFFCPSAERPDGVIVNVSGPL